MHTLPFLPFTPPPSLIIALNTQITMQTVMKQLLVGFLEGLEEACGHLDLPVFILGDTEYKIL